MPFANHSADNSMQFAFWSVNPSDNLPISTDICMHFCTGANSVGESIAHKQNSMLMLVAMRQTCAVAICFDFVSGRQPSSHRDLLI